MLEHAGQVAAALARRDHRDINRRKRSLRRKRLGQQRAFAHTLADISKDGTQPGRSRALGKQIERLQDRQAGLDQRVELLIENQKIVGADGAVLPPLGELGDKIKVGANGEDVEAALGELLARFALGLGRFNLLEDAAGRVPDFADKFSHFYVVADALGAPGRTKLSIRLPTTNETRENSSLL